MIALSRRLARRAQPDGHLAAASIAQEHDGTDELLMTRLLDEPGLGDAELTDLVRANDPLLPLEVIQRRIQQVRWSIDGLGSIAELLADHAIDEIMINGPGSIWFERRGKLTRSRLTVDAYGLQLLVERLLAPLGLRADRVSPIADGRLPDGSRVNVVVPPSAIDGPVVTIRRFGAGAVPLAAFGPADMVAVLAELMARRATVLVVGATSSGKTTLVNALGSAIGQSERVVCIEDTSELHLPVANLVRLEARPANSEGVGGVDLRQLVLTALRMRPDRLVIGEVRGAEAFDLLLAFTSGHRGGLATCHAASAAEGLVRLEVLAGLAASSTSPTRLSQLVHTAFDAVVVVERVDAHRRVRSIVAVGGQPAVDATPRLDLLWSRASSQAAL